MSSESVMSHGGSGTCKVMSCVRKEVKRVRIVTLPPLRIEVSLTSTLSVAVEFGVALLSFAIHELVIGVVTLVSA